MSTPAVLRAWARDHDDEAAARAYGALVGAPAEPVGSLLAVRARHASAAAANASAGPRNAGSNAQLSAELAREAA